jgi:hypothetical protein
MKSGESNKRPQVGLKVHFDGSGKNDTSVLTVGGYFCWDETCSLIEREWNAALIAEGFCEPDGSPGTFHLADFGTSHCKYGTGKWDIKTKRVPFLKRLASIVNRKENHIVSFSVENSQYREFLAQSPHPQVYGPDHFTGCALMAFVFVEVKIEMAGFAKEPVAYIFEKGDRQHEINHAFMEYDAGHPEFENRSIDFSPKRVPSLQAADLTCGKIQEILERADRALGFLDSGLPLTHVDRFERYYSYDGTSEAIMRDNALHDCYVANKAHFIEADRRMAVVIRNNPAVLERRLKRKLWTPN